LNNESIDIDTNSLEDKLLEKLACFVTIKKNSQLRWCIGSLKPTDQLYKNIIQNARRAAISDPRFSKITLKEIRENEFYLEVTILSPMEDKEFDSLDQLLGYLEKNKSGLVIRLDWKQATYLPSVWEQINQPVEFVKSLTKKAGIQRNQFVDSFNRVEIKTYSWEKFGTNWKNI